MTNPRQEAQDALVYYLRLLAVNQNLTWTEDNSTEVREIVNLIIKAVKND